jgi:hypothetical protein
MKVLLLTSEEWNDKKYGNNNMTNWFSGFRDISLAHIYCSGGKPDNNCCSLYFQISDRAMAKSIISQTKAGKELSPSISQKNEIASPKQVPSIAKGEIVRGLRDIVWKYGRIDDVALCTFIESFKPDIVFSQRKASIRILRVEREVRKILPYVPFLVYTADDEYSLRQFSLNPMFWIRRLAVRSAMKKNVKFYDLYYTDAEEQGKEYQKLFHVPTAFLAKCGEFNIEKCHTSYHLPVRIVYAGKLYCNRWKTLEKLSQAIHEVNQNGGIKFHLDIYTQSPLKKRYKKWLDNKEDSCICGRISADEVLRIYDSSDIVLHVESFDIANRLATRYSFSTKIIDCMATGCALMAICDSSQNGLQYLKRNKIAITIDNPRKITNVMTDIQKNPYQLLDYSKKAMRFGYENHRREAVQDQLRNDMQRLIREYKEKQGV